MFEHYKISAEAVEVKVGTYTAVYHRELGALCLLDPAAHIVFKGFKSGRDIPQQWIELEAPSREAELIQQLIARDFLVSETPPQNSRVNDISRKVNIIQLILANACNFGCTYCFEGIQGKEMSVEAEIAKLDQIRLVSLDDVKVDLNDSMYASKERFQHQSDSKNRRMKPADAIRYVENAIEACRSTNVESIMIQFFGGEPLLNWKAINAVLERFGDGHRDGLHIAYSTVTNGSLITKEIAKTFAKYKVAVCVSVDSPTSPSRPLKNGDDSIPIVMQGLRLLQAENNRVAINSALTSSTWDEFDESIVDLAVEVGASEIGVVVDFDPGFYSRYGAANIVDRLWRVVEYGRRRNVVLTGYWHQIFQVLLGYDAVSERGFKNCSAKGAQFSIEPNGSVFSCKAGSTLLGSIEQKKELLNEPAYLAHAQLRRDNPEYCRGCSIEGFCGGLCLGPLEKKYAAIDVVEVSACEFYRGITLKHIEALKPFEVPTFDMAPR